MNIRCFRTEGVFNDRSCELNDRRIVDTFSGFIVYSEILFINELAVNAVEDIIGILHRVVFADSLDDSGLGSDNGYDIHTRCNLDILKDIEVNRVVCSNGKSFARDLDSDNCVLLSLSLGDLSDCFLRDRKIRVIQINIRHVQLFGKHLSELFFGNIFEFKKIISEKFSRDIFLFL